MYSVRDYSEMALDGVRMDAYLRAIERVIRPGSVVLDLGAGTGIFSLLAIRAGAARVHAVDPNPSVWLLPDLARENGIDPARIVVHHGSSLDIAPPERVDVVISDMRGSSPFHGDHLDAIRDVRERWLAPGGVILPARDRMMVALVESEPQHRALARAVSAFEARGFRASTIASSVLNTAYDDRQAPIHANNVISDAACFTVLEHATWNGGAFEGTVDLRLVRGGTAHGLVVWFDATVLDDIVYSNAPGSLLAYARVYCPLLAPVAVAYGDRASVTLRVDDRGQRWAWETTITAASGAEKAGMRQASFLGAPVAIGELLRTASGAMPSIGARGDRVRRILEAADGTRTLEAIADAVDPSARGAARERLLREIRALVDDYGR